MRTNGHDGERFTAQFTSEESTKNDDKHDDGEPQPATQSTEGASVPKAPKSRTKRASGTPRPPRVSTAPAAAKSAPKPAKSTTQVSKKGKGSGEGGKGARRASAPPASIPAPLSLDPKRTLIDHPGQKSAATAARAATKDPRIEREDEISIPPASEDLDDHDERFFAEGEAASMRGEHLHASVKVTAGRASSSDDEERHPSVHVPPERRRKLANYVKMAVAVSGVLCLAAVARVAFSHVSHPVAEGSAAAAQIALAPVPAVAPVPVGVADPPVAAVAAPVEVAPAPVDPPAPTKSALEEKADARKSLERGKLKDAIAAAERSVALDPTDAEAWLLLGAAHLDAGHGKDSRSAFVECTKQAKAGPVGECRAMLR